MKGTQALDTQVQDINETENRLSRDTGGRGTHRAGAWMEVGTSCLLSSSTLLCLFLCRRANASGLLTAHTQASP